MKRIGLMDVVLVVLLACVLAVIAGHRKNGAGDTGAVRFEAVDVWVDSGAKKLAAYQFELAVEKGNGEIVGLEGGEHMAFAEPPYYDPAALKGKRVIVAAFSTGADLPVGKTRVARVHLQVSGGAKPEYGVKLIETCGPDGEKISATAGVK